MDSQLLAHISRFIESKGTDFVPTLIHRVFKTVSDHGIATGITVTTGAIAAGLASFFTARHREELDEALDIKDETFSQMLCRKIREKGMSNADCYKKAHIDRRTFSKILSDIHYRPEKETAIAFALGLELPLKEAEEMLMKAGFAFSDNRKFDLIIKYFIRNNTYDITLINEILLEYDQPILGEERSEKLSLQKRQK